MRKDLIATESFPYAGKRLKAGQEFGASETDAKLLVAIKKARYKTRVMTPDVAYETKVMRPSAEPVREPEAVPMAPRETLRLPERSKQREYIQKKDGGNDVTS